MVARRLVMMILALSLSPSAFALLEQTSRDLQVLRDDLTFQLEKNPKLPLQLSPMLLATPRHHWKESRDDFSAEAIATLQATFGSQVTLVNCPDCDLWRVHVAEKEQLEILNGELAVSELAKLKDEVRYQGAKSLAYLKETPSGVSLRIIHLETGAVLYGFLADATQDLGRAQPYQHLAQERERRERGEALSYVFVNLGLLSSSLFQFEFIEQWGSRNQHLTGIGLSLLNPTFAIGAVYHYMLPIERRLHFELALYYPLQEALQSSRKNATSSLSLQGMVHYNFASSFGVFASVSSTSAFSIGVSFYNPLWFPFLL